MYERNSKRGLLSPDPRREPAGPVESQPEDKAPDKRGPRAFDAAGPLVTHWGRWCPVGPTAACHGTQRRDNHRRGNR